MSKHYVIGMNDLSKYRNEQLFDSIMGQQIKKITTRTPKAYIDQAKKEMISACDILQDIFLGFFHTDIQLQYGWNNYYERVSTLLDSYIGIEELIPYDNDGITAKEIIESFFGENKLTGVAYNVMETIKAHKRKNSIMNAVLNIYNHYHTFDLDNDILKLDTWTFHKVERDLHLTRKDIGKLPYIYKVGSCYYIVMEDMKMLSQLMKLGNNGYSWVEFLYQQSKKEITNE